MTVTIYGTESDSYIQVVKSIKTLLKQAGIEFDLNENEDLEDFLHKKISSVPAVEIDGEEIFSLKKNDEFNTNLRLLLLRLLQKHNYGNLLKIVFPTDFSEYSKLAFEFSKIIANYTNGILMVSHVYTPQIIDINGIIHTLYTNEIVCRTKLRDFVVNYRKEASIDLTTDPIVSEEFLVGYPASEIPLLAEKSSADLIVMATRAPHSFLKRWLGSTASEVISKTIVPTLLIPPNALVKSFENINIAIENPEDLTYILKKIEWVKSIVNAKINVIHINKNLNGLRPKFDKVIQDNQEWHLTFRNITQENPASALLEIGQDLSNDLLVIYHKDRGWLNDLLNKSTSKKIMGQINSPLLVVV
jgi:nucleotide-binding universal stress UspA family protein/glutaredoxin